MRVTRVGIKNFRLLKDVAITLDKSTTLIVGRNNSGKTSFTDIFNKFFGGEKVRFRFEDFSISSHSDLKTAVGLWKSFKKASSLTDEERTTKENEYRAKMPAITLSISIEYDDADWIASLFPFLMDIDKDRRDACIQMEYSPKDTDLILAALSKEKEPIDAFKKSHSSYYSEKIFAVDNRKPAAKRLIERKGIVTELFLTSFIYAQRYIDDQALDNGKKLSKSFEDFYNDNNKDEQISDDLQALLDEMGGKWDVKYKEMFKTLFDDLKTFGYNGLNAHDLEIKAQFAVDKILKGNTGVFYNHSGSLLPESYNGLGFKNLIYITSIP